MAAGLFERFADFELNNKEELLYLRALSQTLDIARVPHLAARDRLNFPALKRMERVAEYMI